MKNALRLLALAALATVFALPASAQTPAAAPAASGPCTEAEAKAALYGKFRENFNKTPELQKVAYESGKEYLSKYGACTDPADKQITAYIQNWVGKYEKAVVEFNCTKAVNETPAQAFQACRDLIAANPDNLKYRLALVHAGIKNNLAGNKSLNAQAAAEARTALQLIEQGKTADAWIPFANQQDAPAGLRYYLAAWSFDTAPKESVTQLIQVAQSNSTFSKEPATYQLLGAAYVNSEFNPLADEYKRLYEGKEETPESAALLSRINAVTDRIIDAYARAVALSNGKPNYAQINTQAKGALATFYKLRHDNSEAGMSELVANVLSKPLPLPGQDPAPTAAPSSSSGVSGANGAGAAPTQPAAAQPATSNPAKPASTPNPGAKPGSTAQKPPKR